MKWLFYIVGAGVVLGLGVYTRYIFGKLHTYYPKMRVVHWVMGGMLFLLWVAWAMLFLGMWHYVG